MYFLADKWSVEIIIHNVGFKKKLGQTTVYITAVCPSFFETDISTVFSRNGVRLDFFRVKELDSETC